MSNPTSSLNNIEKEREEFIRLGEQLIEPFVVDILRSLPQLPAIQNSVDIRVSSQGAADAEPI